MELGVSLPTSGPLASPANIVRIAQEAERLGYAAVWTYERLLRPIAELPSRDGGPPHRIPSSTGSSTSRWRRSAMSPP
jgi:alkanesulfonate monooxygenase SsuD/methylene tetrahydromethanopterin reductase-like flavin-dependent oxidoreductase (luciferase family)